MRFVTREDRTKWLFTIYMIVMVTATLAPPPISPSNGYPGLNLIPVMRSISCFVPDPGQPSTTAFCTRIILGNIALFFPFGLLFPLVFRRWHSVRGVAVAAFIVSVSIELLQFAGRFAGSPRWSDVDDVLFNVIGALLGYVVLILIELAAGWGRGRPT
jgi:glycopeptide antibiotics resistance protein